MLKKYKNMIFDIIPERGFDINDFEIEEDVDYDGNLHFMITYKDTPLSFTFITNEGDYDNISFDYVKFSPQYTHVYSGTTLSVEGNIHTFTNWLESDVNEYIQDKNEIDLWAEYNSGNKTLNLQKIDFDDKSAFSMEEKLQIQLGINELKFLIQKNLNTSAEEQKLIVARLDYLIEASNRLNRFDWKSVAINTIISISITLSLDTEKGRMLFELFKKVFGAIQNAIHILQ